jgi:CDP-glycerol glycerophosphotransferase (TagB/SpsB family)
MRPSPSLQIIKEGDDTLDILKRCHALVTVSSTVILDALMMDRECVLATYLAGESRMDYDAYDAIYSIEGEGQIDEMIQRSMIDKRSYRNKRRLLEDELYLLDGKAGERAAKAIVSMIPEAH